MFSHGLLPSSRESHHLYLSPYPLPHDLLMFILFMVSLIILLKLRTSSFR